MDYNLTKPSHKDRSLLYQKHVSSTFCYSPMVYVCVPFIILISSWFQDVTYPRLFVAPFSSIIYIICQSSPTFPLPPSSLPHPSPLPKPLKQCQSILPVQIDGKQLLCLRLYIYIIYIYIYLSVNVLIYIFVRKTYKDFHMVFQLIQRNL